MSMPSQEKTEIVRVNINNLATEYIGGPTVTWHGKPFTGVAFEITDDDYIVKEITYVEGMEDGLEKSWYFDEQLESESENKWNRPHGLFKEWHESGQLKAEGLIELGYLIWRKEWDEEGNQILEYKIEENPSQLEGLMADRSWAKREEPSYTNLSSI